MTHWTLVWSTVVAQIIPVVSFRHAGRSEAHRDSDKIQVDSFLTGRRFEHCIARIIRVILLKTPDVGLEHWVTCSLLDKPDEGLEHSVTRIIRVISL